ncbi:MAG: PAS domain S-box protein [Desulfobacteraceae bacterium]|nr:PAS domain S-box protein [Desulfobacteraceae bacterium]
MNHQHIKLHHSLVFKLILTVGLVLLVSISLWSYFNIGYQKNRLMENILAGTNRLTNTIRLGTQYAMMLNSRDDITQIIANIAKQPEIKNIRIYNKNGQIKFSNHTAEVDQITNIEAEACYICHRSDPPLETLELEKRIRFFRSPQGYRLLGIITPICNDSGCSTADCHFHPADKKILGALDVVVSLEHTDREILTAEKNIAAFTGFVFLVTSSIILVFLVRFVNRPINRLIEGTRLIARGDYTIREDLHRRDEMGLLAKAVNQMGKDIGQKQNELNKQRDEYQNLFQSVPCLITVQDRNYRLVRYNNEFAVRFAPKTNDYCYHAYKNLDHRCDPCPVEKTFQDGRSHYAEESGVNKDGTPFYWVVRTTPIKDENENIVAAMEISLDITERRQLEIELENSEKKYHAIFYNIPNPVFVLTLEEFTILHCNNSVHEVYGYQETELINTSFLNLFLQEERDRFRKKMRNEKVLNQVRHLDKNGRTLFVNIRISPSEYSGRKVLLITTSDITKRLEAEQQLIQASKMATLGEMATGIAHELNQPLSVIKTTSTFFIRKLDRDEPIAPEKLKTMLIKMDGNVDRAARIINHMRQFARKSDLELNAVQINDVLRSAFEIFSQQLKVRGIDVKWDICDDLPKIQADPRRLEQVFINLLINSRDAIEDKWDQFGPSDEPDYISIRTSIEDQKVVCRICDTGIGIPENLHKKIFEPFFTTKEVGKGTGLGLSISYGIVSECQGQIWVEPNTPQGVCFILTFVFRAPNTVESFHPESGNVLKGH